MGITRISRQVIALLLAITFLPVAGEFFVEFARENGVYDNPSQKVDAVMSGFTFFTESPIFWFVFPLLLGASAALWLDYWFRGDPIPKQEISHPEESVCVKRTWINYNRLENDHAIDFLFEIFNGSSTSITVGDPSGTIILQINGGKENLTTISSTALNIDSNSEGRFSLQLVLSEDVKRKFLVAINEKMPINIHLDNLLINFAINNQSEKSFRLLPWNAFTAYFDSNVKFDIMITASMNA